MEETKLEVADEKKIIDNLFQERDYYQSANNTSRTLFNDIHDAYMDKLTDDKDKSKSQESTNALATEVAYIVPAVFSGQPEMEVEAEGEEDKDLAFVAEKIINYGLQNIPQAYEVIEAWVKQSVVYGTSLLKVCWKFITKNNGDGTETPIKDEPYLEVPNILDCFYNPIISNVEDQKAVIFRSVLPLDDVKNNPIYDYTDALGALNREKLQSKGSIDSNNYDSSKQTNGEFDIKKVADGMIEVYERVSKDRIQTVADGKERLLLRDKPWEFGAINAIKLTHEPKDIPNRFEGDGVGHKTLGLGKLSEKMMNRSLDNTALTNNIYTFFAKGTKIDKKQLVVKPGGGCEVETGGKPIREVVQFAQFPDILQGAIVMQDKIDDKHKRASGANDLLQGAASNKTLGQDQIALTYSSNRFELINRRFKQALADVGRMILMMYIKNIQSIDSPILKIFPLEAEVTDQGQIQYSRETVYQMLIAARDRDDLKFNIKVKGETNVAKNKDIQIKQLIDAYNLFGAILPPQNQMEWARKILQLRGIDEIDKLVPDPEQFAQQAQIDPMTGQPINPQMLQQGMPQQPIQTL
jgi:hypothetical protein